METHGPSKSRRVPRWAMAGAAAALVGATVGVGATQASWTDAATASTGTITAGDLDISLVGTETVTVQRSGSTPTTIDPDTYKASNGDVVTFTQPMTTTLDGDNMSGTLSTKWSKASSLPKGVSGVYLLVNDNDTALSDPAEIGTPVQVRNVPNKDQRPAKLVVRLDFSEADDQWSKDTSLSDAPSVADIGTIEVNLDQVRTGTGFNR